MEKFLFLVLMLMLISRLFHAGSHTIILMLMLMLMLILVLIAQVGTSLHPCVINGFSRGLQSVYCAGLAFEGVIRSTN